MNWEHLKAFLWLRWRLGVNQAKRAGAGAIIQAILRVIFTAIAVLSFILGIPFGIFVLPRASADIFMLAWDGIVVVFLFLSLAELMAELQQSEVLSIGKFLHLPVSLSGVFLINFVGSMYSIAVLVLVPLMLGLSIGLVFSKGPSMLLMFPLIAAFIIMVTALIHQFRAWLASIMTNPRRRRTVAVTATFVFIAIVQIPSLLNFTGLWGDRFDSPRGIEIRKQIEKLDGDLAAGDIDKEQHARDTRLLRGESRDEQWKGIQATAGTLNTVIPLGWLPYGAAAAFEGRFVPPLLGTLGLGLIAAGSLRRSYVTTQRVYTGAFGSKKRPAAQIQPVDSSREKPARTRGYPAAFLEKRLPFLSEHASACAAASLRSFLRAPEAKMMLLTPVIMLVVFGGMFMAQNNNPPLFVRPLLAVGAVTFMLFMMVGFIGNLFGTDRSGFRVFVLAAAPRRDILLGKNLSHAPFSLAFALLAAMMLQLAYPMRVDHYLAVLLQIAPMYLLFCLVGNTLSILAPMPMAPGAMKPVKPKGITILIHMAFFFVFPLALVPTLLPLGAEFLLARFGGFQWIPAYLVLTLAEVIGVFYLYWTLLKVQGSLLERREQRILETVTSKLE